MPFSDFYGNRETVDRLREMLGRRRLPQAAILVGAGGSGKYTLALMLARAMNCHNPPPGDLPDFCGQCSNCARMAQAEDFDTLFQEAVEARENLREVDRKETRILIQTHPDLLVIPPDPPQMMIKVDQVRHVIGSIYLRPSEAKERVYVFTNSVFVKEAANSLLKVLEEPPEFATIFLLTENPGQLLPTIRSRSMTFTLAALTPKQIEQYLGRQRTDWNPQQRSLVAQLSGGAVGRALTFDLESYVAARQQALIMLNTAMRGTDHSELFKITDTFRAGAEGREKIDQLVRTIYSLLEDLMFLKSGTPELVRNTDIEDGLRKISDAADFEWISAAAARLAEVERGMRRNLLRSLSLDAFTTALEGGT
jgi:DNA polymerase-3 subunit delta'